MYRRLKNILGVSLMILAVLIAQIPMPEAQAVETNTITFSMNGGTFSGAYNGYDFNGKTPVLVLDNNKKIDIYPDDQYASYSGYETEKGKWYTDKECIEEFDKESRITKSITVYKKWYDRENGFYLNPDKTVLYQYDGDEKLVRIPDTVTTIAANAFEHLENTRGIVLPKSIETVYDNAFSGVNQENNIIYIYDNDSSQSKKMAQLLADQYEQFVYSSYLDVDKVEEIVGIDYEVEENEAGNKAAEETEDKEEADNKAAEETENKEEPVSKVQEETENKTEEDRNTEEETQEKAEQESKTVPETPREYKVTFDTGLPDVAGETRTVAAHSTVSELVSVAGKEAEILEKGKYSITTDDGKKETTYLFEGWYKDADCKTAWDFANDTIENDTTIYAKWDKKTKNYYDVTFDMNGGKYSGTYEGEAYEKVTRVKTKVLSGAGIQEAGYPDYNADASFRYTGYSTDNNWYTDKNCLSKYNKTDSNGNAKAVKKNMTLYKKWYATTSGFTMNAKKTVLYKYNGGSGDVKIPTTVTTIGNDAFWSVRSVTSVALPDSLTDVEEDAFSGFSAVSKEVTITAKSERAIEIARELAAKYKYLVYEGDKTDAKKDGTETTKKSDSVSVLKSNESGSIEIGAKITGSAGTGSTGANNNTGADATSSTGIALGASTGAPAAASSEKSVTVGGAPAAPATTPAANTTAPTSSVPTVSDAIAAQKPVSSGSSNMPQAAGTRAATTTVSNATAASAPTGTQHVKDSTPRTGDPVQYRVLIVCILFSAGALLVLTGNGKRKKFSPS